MTYKKIFLEKPKRYKNGKIKKRAVYNLGHLKNSSGIYWIYENAILVYIGSATDLYKRISRHFQKHKSTKGRFRISYYDEVEENIYTYRVKVFKNLPYWRIKDKEEDLIIRNKPRDNQINYSFREETRKVQSDTEFYDEIENLKWQQEQDRKKAERLKEQSFEDLEKEDDKNEWEHLEDETPPPF